MSNALHGQALNCSTFASLVLVSTVGVQKTFSELEAEDEGLKVQGPTLSTRSPLEVLKGL